MVHTLGRWICALALLGCATGVFAKGNMMQGCLGADGRPVPVVSDTALDQLVSVQNHNGQSRVHYNSSLAPELTAKQRLFFFAQACSQVRMGIVDSSQISLEQAREADCRAVAMLYHSGVVKSIEDLDAKGGKMVAPNTAWLVLPQPERAIEVAGCLSQVSLYKDGGRLTQLPTESAQDDSAAPAEAYRDEEKGTVLKAEWRKDPVWNRCVNGCAAPLYHCGRKATSGPCYERFNSCVASCPR